MKQGYREEMTNEYSKVTTELQNGIFGAFEEGKSDNADAGSVQTEGNDKHDPNERSEEKKSQKEDPKKQRPTRPRRS